MKKENLPSKICSVCKRSFIWRKKWRLNWDKVKFGAGKFIMINGVKVWAQRLSYVGELGFELYVESSLAKDLYEILIEEGKKFELSHCGMHAMDIMRMESGFVHWGHDISPEENQYQAGLKFANKTPKTIIPITPKVLLKSKGTPNI